MKRVVLLVVMFVAMMSRVSAQMVDVKFNVAAAAIAIFNPSIEFGFCDKSAITMDYVGAYAKENYMGTGLPFMFSMATFGYRHYLLNNNHNGLFVSGDLGLTTFTMNKNIIPFIDGGYPDGYTDSGTGKLLGVTFGYKLPVKDRLAVEFSFSYGWHHCWHNGYLVEDGEVVLLSGMSKSGEWTPYKAGINLSYRLFK